MEDNVSMKDSGVIWIFTQNHNGNILVKQFFSYSNQSSLCHKADGRPSSYLSILYIKGDYLENELVTIIYLVTLITYSNSLFCAIILYCTYLYLHHESLQLQSKIIIVHLFSKD